MLLLNKIITSKLQEISELAHQKQFFDTAIDKEQFPMAIFKFPNINEVEYRNDLILEIDIWNGATANKVIQLEQLTDEIDKKLNRLKYIDDDMQVTIYRLSPYRLNITDEDETIKRRQLRYICKTYFTPSE
ncbi:MAG: hypothetical protein PWQ70_2186 [Clostridiales bacterium]|nr:hypothetical protein [Clostridiales bacterium]